MIYWILLLWIPIGRIYIVAWQLHKAGVTLKEFFTKRIYHIMVIESGIFGFITPILNYMVRRKAPSHLTELDPPQEEKKIEISFS